MLSFFSRGAFDGILNLIESVSEGFPSYSCIHTLAYQSCCVCAVYIHLIYYQSPGTGTQLSFRVGKKSLRN